MVGRMRALLLTGLVAALAIATLTVATAADAGTWSNAPTQLINTDIVAGFAQHATVLGTADARTGTPASRGNRVPPAITADPVAETVTAGGTASFTAAASGTPTPTVQWADSTNGGARWSTIRGANSTTYSFTAASSESGYEYEAIFTNTAGSATTTPATLTVTAVSPIAPKIVTSPANEAVTSGATASFSASASGTPTPTVQWSVSTNGGTSFSAIAGATSTTYSFVATVTNNGDEFDAVFSNGVGAPATTSAATLTVTAAPAQSSNWSGYADPSSSFTAVSATWTVPTVTCTGRSSAYSSEWVGIDGYSSATVEQDGSETDCISGSPSYYAWYEMYGDSAINSGDEVELSPSTNPITPGDSLSAEVSEVSGLWTLSLTDASTKHPWTYSTQIEFATAARSSAEWIVERPEICSRTCSLTSLADFGTVTLSNSSATSTTGTGTISASPDTAIDMVNGSTLLAVPSALDTLGDIFSDTWQAS